MNGRAACLASLLGLALSAVAAAQTPRQPRIDGPWRPIAGNPDLGDVTTDRQQPVDFGIWRAADGTWQLWSCIRHTDEPGQTRLLHRWEGESLSETNWTPMGVAMRANPLFGEVPGGLQAPYVLRIDGRYHMFYGDWSDICLATSRDGKHFQRQLRDGLVGLFGEGPRGRARDPMLLRHDGRWYCYYAANPHDPDGNGGIWCRTSEDLRNWSPRKLVQRGGQAGTNWWNFECPQVHYIDGYFYLIHTQDYDDPQSSVYRSKDPLDFGVDSDEHFIGHLPVAAPELFQHDGQWYIAALNPDLDGIRLAELRWEESEE